MDAQFQIVSLLQNCSSKASFHGQLAKWEHAGRTHHSNKISIHLQQHEQNLLEGQKGSRRAECGKVGSKTALITLPLSLILDVGHGGGSSCCSRRGLGPSCFFLSSSTRTADSVCRTSGVRLCSTPRFSPIYFPTYVLPLRHFSNQYFNILIAV